MKIGCQTQGKLKIVWYLAEPEIYGVGPTVEKATQNLTKQESTDESYGGVSLAYIGNTTIVRYKGKMGLGDGLATAMIDMIVPPGIDGVKLYYDQGRQLWSAGDGQSSLSDACPIRAYEMLMAARGMFHGLLAPRPTELLLRAFEKIGTPLQVAKTPTGLYQASIAPRIKGLSAATKEVAVLNMVTAWIEKNDTRELLRAIVANERERLK